MLNKSVFLDLARHFTVFHQNKDQIIKIVPRYHQYFAVNKALETTKRPHQKMETKGQELFGILKVAAKV